jgi:cellulose synthase/poly-beta-1,6-N-acetylglucosamine synthase-like glycosyltransferase
MVQTRWEHLNSEYSLLTRAQAIALDGHFVIEQAVRNKVGFFINFNGTAGVWRKTCIEDAGNWQADTLTEDLDLSYRAQLCGWKFKYLNNVTSPAELPAEINALKSQQFRWTKGAIETARKILPSVWKSKLPVKLKIHATFHLTNNMIFPFIVVAGILNVPLVFIKHSGLYDPYFTLMSVFVFAFIGSFLFYLFSQKDVHPDWQRRLFLFPLFMAGSMGLAVNNSKAVLEGLMRKRNEWVRTPKYSIQHKKDSWTDKRYVSLKLSSTVVVELVLAVYCLFGVVSSIYFLEIAAVPFQLLFFLGFAIVSGMSIRHAWVARQIAGGK